MKGLNLCAVILTAVLGACGGGGGGDSGDASTATPTSVTCPSGSPAATASACMAVTANVSALQGSTQNPTLFNQGVTLQFNGALDPSQTVVTWKQGTANVVTAVKFAAGNRDMTVTPSMHLAFGSTQTLTISAVDSVGRPVTVNLSFVTAPMVCANNAIWGNPATFVPAYDACVAPIGVQTLMNGAANTMTDTSCVFVVGQPMSAACKAYAANGTLMFANTGVTVGGKATVLVAYYAQGGQSQLALLDATTLSVINTIGFSNSLVWINGNPAGAAIATNVGGTQRREQMTYGSTFVFACYAGC